MILHIVDLNLQLITPYLESNEQLNLLDSFLVDVESFSAAQGALRAPNRA